MAALAPRAQIQLSADRNTITAAREVRIVMQTAFGFPADAQQTLRHNLQHIK